MIYGQYSVVLKTLMDDERVMPLIQRALSTYPMYEPKNPTLYTIIPTRDELNKKLLNFYKYREIGFETIGRFLDELEIAMCEIMPYYNQLMSSEDMMNGIEDIFGNIDITESYEETSTGKQTGAAQSSSSSEVISEQNNTTTSQSSVNSDSSSKTIESETPGNELSITAGDINSISYADKATWNKDNNTSSSESTDTSSVDSSSSSNQESSSSSDVSTQGNISHTLTRKGNQGVNTYAHDMLEFRELFLNIVQSIINDKRIAELFMMVY